MAIHHAGGNAILYGLVQRLDAVKLAAMRSKNLVFFWLPVERRAPEIIGLLRIERRAGVIRHFPFNS